MSGRRAVAVACIALAAVGAGVLAGWLVIGGGRVAIDAHWVDVAVAVGTGATAIGTLVLAGATYNLAVKTRHVVDATRDEVAAARADLEVGREQANTAREALDAQTQPFLTVGDQSAVFLNAGTAHFRNAGNATAVVTRVGFLVGGAEHRGAAVDPAVPPAEGTSVLLADETTAAPDIASQGVYSVVAEFSDVSGRVRGGVRLEVHRRPTPDVPDVYQAQPIWWVRRVFWGNTFEDAADNPAIGSPPRP